MSAVAIVKMVFIAVCFFRCFACPSQITLSTGNALIFPCKKGLLFLEILFNLHRTILKSLWYEKRMCMSWEKQKERILLKVHFPGIFCAEWTQVFIPSIKTCHKCGFSVGNVSLAKIWGQRQRKKYWNSRVISRGKAADCLHSVPSFFQIIYLW